MEYITKRPFVLPLYMLISTLGAPFAAYLLHRFFMLAQYPTEEADAYSVDFWVRNKLHVSHLLLSFGTFCVLILVHSAYNRRQQARQRKAYEANNLKYQPTAQSTPE
jgi:hypothetical protein